MRHCRSDYEAIQPWPTKRPHYAKQNGNTVEVPVDDPDWKGIDARSQVSMGLVQPIIPDDEPVFLIRAQDIVGPSTVRHWAESAERVGAEPSLVNAVRRFADEMDRYAAERYGGQKVPDTPVERLS